MDNTLNQLLADPSFVPPENLFDYDLSSLKAILARLSKKVTIGFVVDEVKLVLPIWEAVYPDDHRPKMALVAALEHIDKIGIITGTRPLGDRAGYAALSAFYDSRDTDIRLSKESDEHLRVMHSQLGPTSRRATRATTNVLSGQTYVANAAYATLSAARRVARGVSAARALFLVREADPKI